MAAIAPAATPSTARRAGPMLAIVLSLAMALPLLAIAWLALRGDFSSWPHLLTQVLPPLAWTTLLLCVGTGVLALCIGTLLGWLVTFYAFPGRRLLRWMALLPLALPGYIISFVYVDALTFAGPLQTALRKFFGWATPGDYWFPEVRSTGGAMCVLALALYPYVYLAARAAFLRQPMNQLHVARTLGRGPLRAFVEVALPQARGALFIGTLLVVMECLNDIGAATFFGVRTLTVGVYSTWLDEGNLAGAAQLALVLTLVLGVLVIMELKAQSRQHRDGRNTSPVNRVRLRGLRGLAASVAVALPVFLGFLVPVALLMGHGLRRLDEAWTVDTLRAVGNSLLLASLACALTCLIALILAHVNRQQPLPAVTALTRLGTLGYALPGTVLGIGVLVPFGAFDQWANGWTKALWDWTPGLLLSGGMLAVLFAYVTRFLIIAVGHVNDGMAKIPVHQDHVARTLGSRPGKIFFGIHLPQLRTALMAASLLVFVDAMKELPATLMLRPFDFETLATRVFALASLGQFEQAAVPSLVIVATGLIPVFILARNLRNRPSGN